MRAIVLRPTAAPAAGLPGPFRTITVEPVQVPAPAPYAPRVPEHTLEDEPSIDPVREPAPQTPTRVQ
jgi:hypothetical protein